MRCMKGPIHKCHHCCTNYFVRLASLYSSIECAFTQHLSAGHAHETLYALYAYVMSDCRMHGLMDGQTHQRDGLLDG